MRLYRMSIVVLFCAATSLAIYGVWRGSYKAALEQLDQNGTASLSLASDRLVGLLERYRILPVALANDVVFAQALTTGANTEQVLRRLQSLADMTGAQSIALADETGKIILNSARLEGDIPASMSIKNRPDFRRAMNGALGIYHAQESQIAPRGFMFASAIRNDTGRPIGALIINTDLEALEFHWRGDPEIIFFTDKNDVIFISNRDSLILKVLNGPTENRIEQLYQSRYHNSALQPLNNPDPTTLFGKTIWRVMGDNDIPNPALLIQQPLPGHLAW